MALCRVLNMCDSRGASTISIHKVLRAHLIVCNAVGGVALPTSVQFVLILCKALFVVHTVSPEIPKHFGLLDLQQNVNFNFEKKFTNHCLPSTIGGDASVVAAVNDDAMTVRWCRSRLAGSSLST